MPPPTGVDSGPLMETRNSLNASRVSSGSHSPCCVCDSSPAYTFIHEIFRSRPYAFSVAASNTRTDARQMSGPVPSPSTKGIIGLEGTESFPSAYEIRSPLRGTFESLYSAIQEVIRGKQAYQTRVNETRQQATTVPNTCHVLQRQKKRGGTWPPLFSANAIDYLSERRRTKISSQPITPESIPVKSAETLAKFAAVMVSDATESPFTLSVDLLPLRSTTISK